MIGKNFGQYEPLTTRLHNLVRTYPKGLGIFKEFIQNADDAEAEEIVFVIDEQQYSITGLPKSMHWLHTTPSLLVYNNRSFTENDIEGIQSIGASGKSESVGKTGRFGLGFNSCYNVTDVPCFFTKENMYFFDPHLKTIPQASSDSPGGSFGVNELLHEGWPLLDSMRMFVIDESLFDGTVFRLPFRTLEMADASKIKNEIYTVEDALECVRELQLLGSAILIFLKHVKNLKIKHRTANGLITELLSIQAVNKEEIINSRSDINNLLNSADPERILMKISEQQQIYSSCIHKYRVLNKGNETTETWRVVDGFFVDDNNQVINACKQMLQNGEKALPYAGAAWKLNCNNQTRGQMYCFLPVPIQTSLPIQINGYFDLDDSRQSMFLDSSSHGSAGIRVKWNKALLENSVVLAYVRLIEELKSDLGIKKIDTYYSAFPRAVENEESWEGWITSAFYKYSSQVKLIKVSSDTTWSLFTEARFLPEDLLPVGDVLISEGFLPIPNPALPEHIQSGFEVNGIEAIKITPHDLRIQLIEQRDVDCPIDAAPRACLRKHEYIKQIFSFCLSNRPIPLKEILGLPLLVDYRGHLRTLGLTKYPLYQVGHKMDIKVFGDHPEWFINLEPCLNLTLQNQENLKLYYMNSKLFVQVLSKFVNEYGNNFGFKINTGIDGIFTDEWLQAVFTRLLDSDLNTLKDEIKKIPLIPDQFLVLQRIGHTSTPRLFHGQNEKLKSVLSDLSVPLVKGASKQLFKLFVNFAEKNGLIGEVTLRDLIDILKDQCNDRLIEYNQITYVQSVLLDYISNEDNLIKLNSLHNYKNKLKTLKIFPTSKGRLVDLSGTAYISQNYSFPTIEVDVILLDCGELNQWRKLYSLLGVKELSRSRLILDWLLPEFKNLDTMARIEASTWLRDNLSIAQNEFDVDGSDELLIELQKSPFIVCDNSELHAPINVYHPQSTLARDILGEQVLLPDMSLTYTENQERWMEFFRQIDMKMEPRLSDILKYVRKLSSDKFQINNTKSFQVIFEYIKKRVDTEIQKDKGLSDELAEMLEELARIAWVPIRLDSGNLICFRTPEFSLVCPKDAYFPRVGQLIASQANITILRPEPDRYTREAMGFPVKASVEMVAKHFRVILEAYSLDEVMQNEVEFEKILSQIYRFFGGEDSGESDGDEVNVKNKEGDYSFDLKANFSEIACIWDQQLKRFWRPEYVFMENVEYMNPWRRTIRNSNNAIERGFDLLGRREKPAIEDWKTVLSEISESGKFNSDTKVVEIVSEIIHHIVMELDRCNRTDGDVLVPTRDGSFIPSVSVFIADAPWYESILDSFHIPILSQSVSSIWGIHRCLRISSLAESIKEKLNRLSDDSHQEDVKRECSRLETLIQSKEFILGIQRLLQNEDCEILEEKLDYLHKIKVRGVKELKTSLYIYFNESEQFLGDSNADFYLNFESLEAMLVEKRCRYFGNDLAEIINRTFKDKLKNLAPLVQMLSCKPSEISEVLDDLKIRKYSYSFKEEPEDEEEIIMQVFPKDDIEVDVPYESNQFSQNNCELIKDKDFEKDEVVDSTEYSQQDDMSVLSYETSSKTGTMEYAYVKSSTKSLENLNRGNISNLYIENAFTNNLSNSTSSNFNLEQSNSTYANDDSFKKSTASNRKNKLQRRLVSYVLHEREIYSNEILADVDSHNLDIEKAAVKIVIEYEKSDGRNARLIEDSNAGYNVIAESEDEVRHIEVKGIEAAWGERGVILSSTQFFYSKDNLDQNYWLYVIENVYSKTPSIHKIHNPVEMVNYYAVDGGWSQVAESIEWKGTQIKEPEIGDEVFLNESLVGIVESIKQFGKFQRVYYRALDGTIKNKLKNDLVFKEKEEK
ncbi:hypothetical protein CCS79_08905 [Clostridium diolis]|uniref:DUF3883 domain-containing protein n=1 Tax=Clostridium diolis TaxID=223919 RepID=UPI000B405365|nr:DUF3883 domain-containing protein [Clostridium diolis]OVE69035.1 hypothetical protein CCS79_08905 [Clostridium diolis]